MNHIIVFIVAAIFCLSVLRRRRTRFHWKPRRAWFFFLFFLYTFPGAFLEHSRRNYEIRRAKETRNSMILLLQQDTRILEFNLQHERWKWNIVTLYYEAVARKTVRSIILKKFFFSWTNNHASNIMHVYCYSRARFPSCYYNVCINSVH